MCSVPIVRGECLLKYHFRPQQEWQRSVGIFGFSVFGCWLETAFQCESVLREDAVQASSADSYWWLHWGSCQAINCVLRGVSLSLKVSAKV